MAIIPSKNSTTVIDGASGLNLDNLETYEVPFKAEDGTLQSSGIRMLSSGSLLAPVGFAVESGSIDFGDVIRLSESAGFLAFENLVDSVKYQLVDYAVPRNAASSKPYYFKLNEAEKLFQATSGNSTITTNPLTFDYTTRLAARTNALIFTATQMMTNVRIRITDKLSGVAVKYFPSKSSWLSGKNGTIFEVGNNTIDFQDTALIFQAGTTLTYDIQADNIALSGTSGIPAISAMLQQGVFIGVADSKDIANLQSQISTMATPFSGKYADLTGIPTSFPPSPHTHSISDVNGLADQLSALTTSIQGANSSLISLSTVATSGSYQDLLNKPVLFSGSYADLSGKPSLFSGSYNDLTNKPSIPVAVTKTSQLENDSGYFTSVNYPVVSVNAKTGAVVLSAVDVGAAASLHTHSIADITGLQNSLDSKASTTSLSGYATADSVNSALGNYTNTQTLTNLLNGKFNNPTGTINQYLRGDGTTATFPMIPAAQVNSDWNATSGAAFILNKPTLFSGSYTDLINKPVIFSGAYSDLTGKPVLFSGNYADLTNKPTLFDGNYASLTGKPTTFTPAAHTHVIADVTGLQAALNAKLTTPAGTTSQYVRGDGSLATLPVIPTNVSAFTNDAGYLTSAALPIYRRIDNTVVTAPVKVKYYTATSDTNSVWTVNLGTDFTEVLDVQVTAVSIANTVAGVRQASLNGFTSTSTNLSGITTGNNVLSTVLISAGANTLALIPSTVVRVTVTGKGS